MLRRRSRSVAPQSVVDRLRRGSPWGCAWGLPSRARVLAHARARLRLLVGNILHGGTRHAAVSASEARKQRAVGDV